MISFQEMKSIYEATPVELLGQDPAQLGGVHIGDYKASLDYQLWVVPFEGSLYKAVVALGAIIVKL